MPVELTGALFATARLRAEQCTRRIDSIARLNPEMFQRKMSLRGTCMLWEFSVFILILRTIRPS
jgi:hypothetical protein